MASDRLDAIEAEVLHHPDPVVTASEVVDALEDDLTRRTVLDDLRVLERSGALESKETGARAVAWWHHERVVPAPPRDPADHPDQREFDDLLEEYPDREERVDDLVRRAEDFTDSEELIDALEDGTDEDVRAALEDDRDDELQGRPEFVDDRDVQDDADDAIDAALEGWRPGQGAQDRAERREVGREVLGWLRSEGGPRERSEFVSALYESTALEGQGEKSWWERLVRPALNQAIENDAVYKPTRTQYLWVK